MFCGVLLCVVASCLLQANVIFCVVSVVCSCVLCYVLCVVVCVFVVP